jgi:hypothetical protein
LIATLSPNQAFACRMRRSYLSPPPASLPPPAAANEAHDEQKQHGTYGGIDDGSDQSGTEMDAELGQQPASDQGTQQSDDKVADEPEAGSLHELTRQPAGDEANKQDDQQALARHVHVATSGLTPKQHHSLGSVRLYNFDQFATRRGLYLRGSLGGSFRTKSPGQRRA